MATSIASSIVLTPAAKTALDLHFQGNEKPPLRIYMSFMHGDKPRLELAPDVQNPADTLCKADGWTFLITTLLLEQAAPLTVDIGPEGFLIHSNLDFSQAGGNCGGACDSH